MRGRECRARLQSCVRKAVAVNTLLRKTSCVRAKQLHSEMSRLSSWDTFNVNTVAKLSNRQPLQAIGFACFEKYGLIQKFDIHPEVMHNFLITVEEHYLCAPPPASPCRPRDWDSACMGHGLTSALRAHLRRRRCMFPVCSHHRSPAMDIYSGWCERVEV